MRGGLLREIRTGLDARADRLDLRAGFGLGGFVAALRGDEDVLGAHLRLLAELAAMRLEERLRLVLGRLPGVGADLFDELVHLLAPRDFRAELHDVLALLVENRAEAVGTARLVLHPLQRFADLLLRHRDVELGRFLEKQRGADGLVLGAFLQDRELRADLLLGHAVAGVKADQAVEFVFDRADGNFGAVDFHLRNGSCVVFRKRSFSGTP